MHEALKDPKTGPLDNAISANATEAALRVFQSVLFSAPWMLVTAADKTLCAVAPPA